MTTETAIQRLIQRNRNFVSKHGTSSYSRETDEIINALLQFYHQHSESASADLTDMVLAQIGGSQFRDDVRRLPIEWQRLFISRVMSGDYPLSELRIDFVMHTAIVAMTFIEQFRRDLHLYHEVQKMPEKIKQQLAPKLLNSLRECYLYSSWLTEEENLENYKQRWTIEFENQLMNYGNTTNLNQDGTT